VVVVIKKENNCFFSLLVNFKLFINYVITFLLTFSLINLIVLFLFIVNKILDEY